jgi:Polysaccharide pyruvyl transferase
MAWGLMCPNYVFIWKTELETINMRVFLLGATPQFDLNKQTTLSAKLSATGNNSGNQVIAYGLLKTFQHTAVDWDYTIGPDRVNAEYDVIVVAAANFLFPAFDLGGMADFIARTKLPVVMVGLGAQSSDPTNPVIPLKEGTLRLVQVVSERSVLIGVRGEYTARVLAHLGIKNVQVTGCPSYYLPGEAGYMIRDEAFDGNSPIAIHASRDVFDHSFDEARMRSIVFDLYAEAARRKGIFVAQTEVEEMVLAESRDPVQRAAALENLMNTFKGIDQSEMMKAWFESAMRVYWTVPEWTEAMKQYPFVLGTRFHGTMAALHGGTPAVCICHDSRTTEMCEFLGIPHVALGSISKLDIEMVRQKADFPSFMKRYGALHIQYKAFLKANNLPAA